MTRWSLELRKRQEGDEAVRRSSGLLRYFITSAIRQKKNNKAAEVQYRQSPQPSDGMNKKNLAL